MEKRHLISVSVITLNRFTHFNIYPLQAPNYNSVSKFGINPGGRNIESYDVVGCLYLSTFKSMAVNYLPPVSYKLTWQAHTEKDGTSERTKCIVNSYSSVRLIMLSNKAPLS